MIKVIPAIDIIDGKCVRLTKGNYNTTKVYSDSPIDVALEFQEYGLENLHLVDLDGAKSGKVVNLKILEQIAEKTQLTIDFGGGVKTLDDLKSALSAGASKINLGSIAVKDPEIVYEWISKYPNKIILSADVKHNRVAINGWQSSTEIDIFDHVESFMNKGLTSVTCTDIDTDGMLNGPNFRLYKNLKSKFPSLEIIASGGIHKISDIFELNYNEIDGVIIGKAIYEGLIELSDLKQFSENA